MPGYSKVAAKHYYNFTQLEVKAALLDYLQRKGLDIPNGSATVCDGYSNDPVKNSGFSREAKVVLFIQEH